jgi:carboxypeptidase Taq
MIKTSKAQDEVGAATTPPRTSKSTRNRRPAEEKLAELKRRLHDINDLTAAGAALGWDQATYMPIGGAGARGRQRAALSRLAHEKSVDSTLGKLLDELEPYAATLPYDSNEASLIRVAKRDFERAIKVPSDHVARTSAFGVLRGLEASQARERFRDHAPLSTEGYRPWP